MVRHVVASQHNAYASNSDDTVHDESRSCLGYDDVADTWWHTRSDADMVAVPYERTQLLPTTGTRNGVPVARNMRATACGSSGAMSAANPSVITAPSRLVGTCLNQVDGIVWITGPEPEQPTVDASESLGQCFYGRVKAGLARAIQEPSAAQTKVVR